MSAAKKIPTASAIEAPSAPLAPITVDEILEHLKGRSAAELFKVLKAVATLSEKASKVATSSKKGTKKAAAKKDSDVPLSPEEAEKAAKRGAQLDKPRAWVTFVGEHARANGWPAFPAKVTATDKLTKVKTESIVEMPESEEKDGTYVFPDGKAFNHKHAMSLSKSYWVAAKKVGTRQDLYAEFEAQYVAPVRGVSAEGASAASAAASEADDDAEEAPVTPVKAKKAVAKKVAPSAPAKPKQDEFVAPKDGKFAAWTHNGRALRRNNQNYVVGPKGDDTWIGQYNPETDEIEECDAPEEFYD
jgi:hypothetical protein